VTDSGVDIVLLCNPPIFRPDDFDYVIEKGKHCFMEKPAATDPTGVRQALMAGRKAAQKGLSVVTGTCLRSSRAIIETYKRVANGAIGPIMSAHVTRLGGALWFRQRDPRWSDMEYILRNWVSFCRTSGDFVVEMFVHEIDLMTWFLGEKTPERAESTGGRQRRQTGDMYDHFSMTYIYEGGLRAHCTSRQIAGCDNRTGVFLYGTKGYVDARNSRIFNYDGSIAWEYPTPKSDDPDQTWAVPNIMVQEHIRLVNSIRTGKPVNETEQLANSTLVAIMGRESAYTGKFVTWNQIMASDQNLRFQKNEFGSIPGFKEEIPVAGTAFIPQ
jgi:predicted dehydrogenase